MNPIDKPVDKFDVTPSEAAQSVKESTAPIAEESTEIPVTPEQTKPAKQQQSVMRSAGIVSIAVMFSRVLGLLREVVFA
ncbi:MAG: hypothetical protein H7Z37_10995, partial [Pyrinomonadaceae bacterium]|nr:hypothetical protein [Pyrinomonadaceae bacterium]